MRRLCTLIFIGSIGFTGFAAHAQMLGTSDSLSQGLASGDISTAELLEGMIQEAKATSAGPTRLETSIIQEGEVLVVEEEETSQDDVVPAEAVNTKTKRYAPRLKIDFAEFPLRSLDSKNRRSGEAKTQRDIIVQRIQKRLRMPSIELVMKDRTAIISGTVTTDRQRSLAASMLRFEPGIDVVQNEITVVPQLQDLSGENQTE